MSSGVELVWHAAGAWPMILAVALPVLFCTLWLYRPQFRFISGPWRWILPALRLSALAALGLALARPAIIAARQAQEQGALIVLVDRSRSMSVVDGLRLAGQLVALADGFGLLPPGVRMHAAGGIDAAMASLDRDAREFHALRKETPAGEAAAAIRQYRAGLASLRLRGQAFPRDSRIGQDINQLEQLSFDLPPDAWLEQFHKRLDALEISLAEVRAAADAELFQSDPRVKSVCDGLAGKSRMELTAQALTGQGILQRLGGEHRLQLAGFDQDVLFIPPQQLFTLQADGMGSDITGALRQVAAGRHRFGGVRAYVLLSDGRAVDDSMLDKSSIAGIDAPVFAVPVASPLVPKDVSIAAVSLSGGQFLGESMTVAVALRQHGLSGSAADVHLDSNGARQSQRIVLSDDAIVQLEFNLKIDSAPAQKLEIIVDPLPGEVTPENNRAHRRVKVISQKLAVAAWSSSPSWDFQYLRNTLARTSWVALDEAILAGDARPSSTASQIMEKDVVILHDLSAAALSGEQWSAIHQFVSARGGSLILIAGDAHLPAEYGQNELLASLLPYRGGLKPVWRVWPGQSPAFQLIPAPSTETVEALRLADDPVEGRQRWNVLPGWFRYLSIAELKPNTSALLVERDSKAPVLTESRLGLGRVLFFGGNETWRWRLKTGEEIQDRFWLQLLRHAAGQAYAATSENGNALDLERLSIAPADSVRVRVRLRDADGAPSKTELASVQIFRGQEEIRRLALPAADGDAPGRYETILSDLTPGDYQIRLPVEPPLSLDLYVETDFEAELRDLSGDEKSLARLAEQSGGELIPLNRISELPGRIDQRVAPKIILAEYSLWDSPWLFLFVVSCLAAEWALRKAVGLA